MKDKVCIRPSEFDTPWCIDEDINSGGVEYIRKDALLEWAKMKKDHIKIVDWDADYYFGLDFMLDELIDKLNEM